MSNLNHKRSSTSHATNRMTLYMQCTLSTTIEAGYPNEGIMNTPPVTWKLKFKIVKA